jgi:hypothetical protein
MAAATGTPTLRPRLTSIAGTSTAGTSTFWTDTIGTSAVAVILDGDPVPLPGTPWSVRPAAGPAGRQAVEIYAAGSMLDVMVAPRAPRVLAPRVLRGACSLAWAGHPWAVAWGFLPPRPGLSVWFARGPARSRRFAAPVSEIAGTFWVAPAEGRFRAVTVEHGGGSDRCRVRAARPC